MGFSSARVYIEVPERSAGTGALRIPPTESGILPVFAVVRDERWWLERLAKDRSRLDSRFGVSLHDVTVLDEVLARQLVGRGLSLLDWVVAGQPGDAGSLKASCDGLKDLERVSVGFGREYPAVVVEARMAMSTRSLADVGQFVDNVAQVMEHVDVVRLQLWPMRTRSGFKVPAPADLRAALELISRSGRGAYARGKASIGLDTGSGVPLCFVVPEGLWLCRLDAEEQGSAGAPVTGACSRCAATPWCAFARNASLFERYGPAFVPHLRPFERLPQELASEGGAASGPRSGGRRVQHVHRYADMGLEGFRRAGADAHLWRRAQPSRVRIPEGALTGIAARAGFAVTLVRLPASTEHGRVAARLLPPLSLLQLSGTLEKAGFAVDVSDLGGIAPEGVGAALRELAPAGLLGVSVEAAGTLALLPGWLDSVAGAIPVVAGGRGITDGPALLEQTPRLDFVVEGEGDFPLVALASALAAARPPRGIPGLVWRTGSQVVRNASAHHDLNVPGYSSGHWVNPALYPETKFPFAAQPVLPAMFVHGCPYHCAFCGDWTGGIIRTRDPERVAEQLQNTARTTGITNFLFLNTLINASPKYLSSLLDCLEKLDPQICWADSAKPRGLNQETLARMKKAGCVALTWGIDTGSSRLAAMVNKAYDPRQASLILKWSAQSGISNVVNLIAGLPHETEDDIAQAQQWLREHRPWVSHVNIMKYLFLENSLMHREPQKYGLTKRKAGNRFDEVGGLSWEDKKVQITESWRALLKVAGEMGYGFVTGSGSEPSSRSCPHARQ